jgi:hypothetical protein
MPVKRSTCRRLHRGLRSDVLLLPFWRTAWIAALGRGLTSTRRTARRPTRTGWRRATPGPVAMTAITFGLANLRGGHRRGAPHLAAYRPPHRIQATGVDGRLAEQLRGSRVLLMRGMREPQAGSAAECGYRANPPFTVAKYLQIRAKCQLGTEFGHLNFPLFGRFFPPVPAYAK